MTMQRRGGGSIVRGSGGVIWCILIHQVCSVMQLVFTVFPPYKTALHSSEKQLSGVMIRERLVDWSQSGPGGPEGLPSSRPSTIQCNLLLQIQYNTIQPASSRQCNQMQLVTHCTVEQRPTKCDVTHFKTKHLNATEHCSNQHFIENIDCTGCFL